MISTVEIAFNGTSLNAPSLNKDLVLIHGDESAKGPRGEFVEQYRVGRPVAFEHLALHQGLVAGLSAQLLQSTV